MPLMVAKCTNIVETKGLNIVGIYRIPGNTAAISNLNELINRNGMDEQTLSDPKWDDVNVVSSLLKLFIRSLPEPILPNELYGSFIDADKIPDQAQRFHELKTLLRKLPQHNYETLKHLIAHLTRVSQNAAINLMEPRNLGEFTSKSAMIDRVLRFVSCFSNRVRSINREEIQRLTGKRSERHETSVSDRGVTHQSCKCQLSSCTCGVSTFHSFQYGFFFENDPLPKLKNKNFQTSNDSGSELPSADFLLENVAKIERKLSLQC